MALAPASASAARSVMYLDAYDPGTDQYSGPVKMKKKLTKGRLYVATVRGTASYFNPDQYRAVCRSAPLPRPIYKSPRRANGPVGFDAEFTFSEPRGRRQCAAPNPPFPNAALNLRAGGRYVNPTPLGSTLKAPRSTHRYKYAVVGTGRPLRARLRDRDTRDNYGRFRISVRLASARHCSNNGYVLFGKRSEEACRAAVTMARSS